MRTSVATGAAVSSAPVPVRVPYDELAPQMATGDVILMHGTFSLSRAIQFIERSYWTHSGFVVRGEDVGLGDEVLFWESNSDPIADVRFGTDKPGPMLDSLRQRIVYAVTSTGDMDFAWRKLTVDRTPADVTALWDLMPTVHEAGFPNDLTMLFDWLMGKWFGVHTSEKKIFCAELVAKTYQTIGWLPSDRPPNAFCPRDFSAAGNLALLQGATLGPEVHIAPPPPPPPTVKQ